MNRSDFHPYQHKAVDWITRHKRSGLFLDMGLGKTAVTLTAISDLIDARIIKRTLVIAPLRVANSVWKQEAAKWEHLRHLKVSVCTGTAEARRDALNTPADVYVINRENTQWLVDGCKGKWPYQALILDEASSFKSSKAKRFRKLKKPSSLCTVATILTGTPAPNGLIDLWSQAYLMDNGESLGRTVTGFRQRFFLENPYTGVWEPKEGSHDEIHRLLRKRVLSMTAADYLTLPDRIDLVERVRLSEAVMKDYRKFEKNLLIELSSGDTIEAVSVGVLANKLLQWANGAIYTGESKQFAEIHTAKLDALADIVADNAGENILVAYNYQSDLVRLKKRFPQAEALTADGSAIDRWNAGKIPLLLAHPASCGHGINLQDGGSMVVWFGLNWSLELDQQMNARIHRQGQTRPVRIVRIVAAGTIDERVLSVLGMKSKTQNNLIKALKEGWKL